MVLDNEEQRELLIKIVRFTPVSGSYEQAREAVEVLEELLISIEKAEINKS